MNFDVDRQEAAKWAYELLQRDDWLILDTETTGLHRAEICEIAMCDRAGRPLLSSLVRPLNPIPADASRIHGIGNADVQNAPTFVEIFPMIQPWLNRTAIIYNANFDLGILSHCLKLNYKENHFQFSSERILAECAMQWYSQWCGEWNNYHGNYRWQKLPGGDHSALGDCRATLDVIKQMAASYREGSESANGT